MADIYSGDDLALSQSLLSRGKSRKALEAAQIRVGLLEPIPPSMEDVFVSLIEKEEKAAA